MLSYAQDDGDNAAGAFTSANMGPRLLDEGGGQTTVPPWRDWAEPGGQVGAPRREPSPSRAPY